MLLPPVSEFIAGALRTDSSCSDITPKSQYCSDDIFDSISEGTNSPPSSRANSSISDTIEMKMDSNRVSNIPSAAVHNPHIQNALLENQHLPIQHHFQNRYLPHSLPIQGSQSIQHSQQPLYVHPNQQGFQQFYNLQTVVNGVYPNQVNGMYCNMVQVMPGAIPGPYILMANSPSGSIQEVAPDFRRYPVTTLESPYDFRNPFHVNSPYQTRSNEAPYSHQQDRVIRRKKIMHTRTRTGCLTCKRRRVKCDEGKPGCNNCLKSNRKCDGYAENASRNKKRNQQISSKEIIQRS
ncbi:hypothetical protein CLIB1423_26S00518 [[Candida] railenensis]|uniref:Zn(2)-C6 fungal-type domain-containing protein n=1 Tax=[Candida] railenensis TaxID=45579 RepID=A0A9P0VZU3_9ASCO|nr:hypothetical protein CLIB1423_26S00518 [[Candida] railenensis]